jgi:hypothetical protein
MINFTKLIAESEKIDYIRFTAPQSASGIKVAHPIPNKYVRAESDVAKLVLLDHFLRLCYYL